MSPQQQNRGSFKLEVRAYSWRGLSRGEFSIELQRSTESKLQLTEDWRVNSILVFHLDGASVPTEIKAVLSCRPRERELGLCFIFALLFDCLFPYSCLCSPRIINYQDLFKGKHLNQDLIPKELRPKWIFLCQESHSWFSFSRDPLTYLLTIMPLEMLRPKVPSKATVCDLILAFGGLHECAGVVVRGRQGPVT